MAVTVREDRENLQKQWLLQKKKPKAKNKRPEEISGLLF